MKEKMKQVRTVKDKVASLMKTPERHREVTMKAAEYLALNRLPYHNMEVDEDSVEILRDRLKTEGQLKWIIVNENPETGVTNILYSVEEFELMKELEFEEIRMKVFSLGSEEERMLYEDRNLVIAQFPEEVRDQIITERLEREIEAEETTLAKMRAEFGDDEAQVKQSMNKNIGNYIASMTKPHRKAFKGMISVTIRKAGLRNDEEALLYMGRTTLKHLELTNKTKS